MLIDFYSIFDLLTNDFQELFFLKILIFNQKEFIKAKIINTDNQWKLVTKTKQ